MILALIGTGHMGGSMTLALKAAGFASKVLGVDTNAVHLQKALDLQLIDEAVSLETALEQGTLIILAVPVEASCTLLPQLLDQIGTHQTIMDIASVKQVLCLLVENHPNRNRFVATHPMAGTEYSGPEAAKADLYSGRTAVLVEQEKCAPDALAVVRQLYRALDMRVVEYDAVAHDRHAAYVSHISHISSFALALTTLEKEKNERHIFDLAAGGFSSTVRLAKSDPDMWTSIFKYNAAPVLEVLDEYMHQLQAFRKDLEAQQFDQLKNRMVLANKIKKVIP